MLLARSRLLAAVTPSSVPPVLVKTSSAPPDSLSVPPSIVPPARFQEPVVAFRASVVPVSSSVPVRFTVPPVRLNVPRPASVNRPPRFTVEFVALIVPALLQALVEELDWSPRFNVAPVAAIVEPTALAPRRR